MNAFTPSAIAQFRTKVDSLLRQDLGMPSDRAEGFTQFAEALLFDNPDQALAQIAQKMESTGIRTKWNRVLWETRSKFIAEWIAPYIVGALLDLLCGHGGISEFLSHYGIEVTLSEREGIYPEDWKLPNLPYISLSDLIAMPPAHYFDTVVLSTVLHHESDPEVLLSVAGRLAKRRIIIVENCLESDYPPDFQLLMDIFFNHCLNLTDLESPAVHRSIEGWLSSVSSYGKIYHIERRENIPGIPLSHQLIVIDVNS